MLSAAVRTRTRVATGISITSTSSMGSATNLYMMNKKVENDLDTHSSGHGWAHQWQQCVRRCKTPSQSCAPGHRVFFLGLASPVTKPWLVASSRSVSCKRKKIPKKIQSQQQGTKKGKREKEKKRNQDCNVVSEKRETWFNQRQSGVATSPYLLFPWAVVEVWGIARVRGELDLLVQLLRHVAADGRPLLVTSTQVSQPRGGDAHL